MRDDITFGVSDFVALVNQTFEYAYTSVSIVGELANYKISKNRWVYFDLKDEHSSIKFFGTVYMLPGPLEEGMILQVSGTPRLHNKFGFSVNIRAIKPVGEGSIKKASDLLKEKLSKEGLFDESRKRTLPYPPSKIGLITSKESAAYHDFIKVLNERWGGVEVFHADVQVQGASAPQQIISALDYFNTSSDPVDVLVITRGGGSIDDLSAFSTEQVTRAVAGSRIPTLVAIGHEVDISLAELVADKRASTPSNASELLVPERHSQQQMVSKTMDQIHSLTRQVFNTEDEARLGSIKTLNDLMSRKYDEAVVGLKSDLAILNILNPINVLNRGYAIVRNESSEIIDSIQKVSEGEEITIQLRDGKLVANLQKEGIK